MCFRNARKRTSRQSKWQSFATASEPNPRSSERNAGHRPGPVVRGTFSPARAWRPAVVARLARTLGISEPLLRAPVGSAFAEVVEQPEARSWNQLPPNATFGCRAPSASDRQRTAGERPSAPRTLNPVLATEPLAGVSRASLRTDCAASLDPSLCLPVENSVTLRPPSLVIVPLALALASALATPSDATHKISSAVSRIPRPATPPSLAGWSALRRRRTASSASTTALLALPSDALDGLQFSPAHADRRRLTRLRAGGAASSCAARRHRWRPLHTARGRTDP